MIGPILKTVEEGGIDYNTLVKFARTNRHNFKADSRWIFQGVSGKQRYRESPFLVVPSVDKQSSFESITT